MILKQKKKKKGINISKSKAINLWVIKNRLYWLMRQIESKIIVYFNLTNKIMTFDNFKHAPMYHRFSVF